jgi:membrane peptidoglycan carboxypeptidase
MLVSRLEDREGKVIAQYSRNACDGYQRISRENGAAQTVTSPDGTRQAALEHWTVAGKTGTAQKAAGGHYVDGKYVASFIGFFPADNPELCISIVMDEPKQGHFGGQIAAPVFRQVAERAAAYLSIRPDIFEDKPVPTETTAASTSARFTERDGSPPNNQ